MATAFRDVELWLTKSKTDTTARCIAERPPTTTYVLTKTTKATHSWPIICRHNVSVHGSDNDNDDNHGLDDDDGDCGNSLSAEHSANCNPLVSQSIERKHLITDYNQRDFHTTTSIHHAQSDFIEAATLKVQQRFPTNRNSIVPLMQQEQQHQMDDGPNGGNNSAIGHRTTTTTTTTTPTATPTSGSCLAPSPIIFLTATLFMTVAATATICFAIMSDHWELVRWDRNLLNRLTNNNTAHTLHWHLDERVARMTVTREYELFVWCFLSVFEAQIPWALLIFGFWRIASSPLIFFSSDLAKVPLVWFCLQIIANNDALNLYFSCFSRLHTKDMDIRIMYF